MPLTPITQKEIYLATASGDYSGDLPEPITREEMYLKKIAENGSGGSVDAYTKAETDAKLLAKVDKVSGKGLSTNDFTPAEKEKLSNCQTGWIGTESEYNALTQKDFDLYFIYEDDTAVSNSNGALNMGKVESSEIPEKYDTLDVTAKDDIPDNFDSDDMLRDMQDNLEPDMQGGESSD
jgi:hypothetical protein